MSVSSDIGPTQVGATCIRHTIMRSRHLHGLAPLMSLSPLGPLSPEAQSPQLVRAPWAST